MPGTNEILRSIEDRTPRGIAMGINRLISAGVLSPGDRLPTVRELARALGVSPATVSEAWQALAGAGSIQPRGRLGTFVLDTHRSLQPVRYRRMSDGGATFRRDLSHGTPDPDLLPDLGPALARIQHRANTDSYLDDPVVPALREHLLRSWPFEPGALTVVDGALDAMSRIAELNIRYGDRVLVENPCFPPVVDLIERLGAQPIGLRMDDEGVDPDALAEALRSSPVALFLQPRAHNPTGVSMTAGRARRLARVIRHAPAGDLLVIEDDHSGDIATAAHVSLGVHLPETTVHIRSFSKSHGPELRIAAVGGASSIIEAMVARRMLGPGWTSRILQALLVELLADPVSIATVERARDVYAARRGSIRGLLAARGVPSSPGDGVNLWVGVADERTALVNLAARGIRVAPGSPFLVAPLDRDHIRVTVGSIVDEVEPIAKELADASRPPVQSRRV